MFTLPDLMVALQHTCAMKRITKRSKGEKLNPRLQSVLWKCTYKATYLKMNKNWSLLLKYFLLIFEVFAAPICVHWRITQVRNEIVLRVMIGVKT